MGMCLDDHGEVSIEIRRESFIVHTSSDNDIELPLCELYNLKRSVDEAIAYTMDNLKRA